MSSECWTYYDQLKDENINKHSESFLKLKKNKFALLIWDFEILHAAIKSNQMTVLCNS